MTDGSPARDSHFTSIKRESKRHGDFLTSQKSKTAATEVVDSDVKFASWNGNSALSFNKHKLISNPENKHWIMLNVAFNKNTFLTSELLNSIRGTKHFPYYRRRRNAHSPRSNGSVAMPSVNLGSSQIGTVPGDIQTNAAAHPNSGSSVPVSAGGVQVSQIVDRNANGDIVAETPLVNVQSEPVSGQVHQHANGSMREPSSLESASHDNTRGNQQGSAPRVVSPGSQPGDTPGGNTQSGALDRPLDVNPMGHVIIEPAGGAAPLNLTEASEHPNPETNAAFPNTDTNRQPARNATNEEQSHVDALSGSGNGSNSNIVYGPSSSHNSNTSSNPGSLSPAVINNSDKIILYPHPTNEQDNTTEIDKPRSDQNSSAAVNFTSSIPGFVETSAAIIPSLQQLDLSLIATSNYLRSVTLSESISVLETGLILQSEVPVHSIASTRTLKDIFSSPTQMLSVSQISSTVIEDITPPSRHILDGEITLQTVITQPTAVVLPEISSQDTTLHSVSPSTSQYKTGVGIPNPGAIWAGSINEQLQSSLPSRITTSTVGPSSPSEITPALIQTQDNAPLSNPPHFHYLEASSTPAVASTSRPLIVVVVHQATILPVLAHPTGAPPPRDLVPDAPQQVHQITIEPTVTAQSNQGPPNTEGNAMEDKTTAKVSTASEESTNNHQNGGTSVYTTTAKATSSGNATGNETETPTSYMELKFGMSWPSFCQQERTIRQELVDILQVGVNTVEIAADQIQVMDRGAVNCAQGDSSDIAEIRVHMYVTNGSHQFDRELTLKCALILKAGIPFKESEHSIVKTTLKAIVIYDKDTGQDGQTTSVVDIALPSDSSDNRVTLAIALAVVGGCCCVALIVLQVVVRRRNRDPSPAPSITSRYTHSSTDSIQLASVVKSRPNSGLTNPGLDIMQPPDPTHPMNYMQLSNFCMDETKITEEYQKLPQRMPRPSMVPAGEEDKNRYSNIVPLVHTRVKLAQDGPGPSSTYINANYVTGPNNQCQYYIATQAPTEKTVTDFWTMIWQQGCQTIVMLTGLEEQGQIKCASYWPELVGKSAAHKHGDFLIELIQKDVHQEYIVSRLEINNQRKIENRQIDHFWYTCWPPNGLPEPISLVKLVLDVRPKYENGTSPLVVHCSPGTGRTCTFIALDLCMKQFETKRIVDVMKTVNSIRQERAGAIQNKEQYALLYNAVHEYAAIVTTPGISATSSAATLQALLSS
ncbi:hypothetical protein BsWGS_00222 [Bradybaena similaris]